MCLESLLWYFQVHVRFGDIWRLWSFSRCTTAHTFKILAMDGSLPTARLISYFDTRYNFELYFKVIPILLKSGLSNSREEAVEDVNKCRSKLIPWCCQKLMSEVTTYYHNAHARLYTQFLQFSKPLLTATLSTLYSILSFSSGENINSTSEIDWNSLRFIIDLFIYYIISTMIYVIAWMSE